VSIPHRAKLEALGGFEPSYLYGRGQLSIGDDLSNGD
jgi:hypothetical protein